MTDHTPAEPPPSNPPTLFQRALVGVLVIVACQIGKLANTGDFFHSPPFSDTDFAKAQEHVALVLEGNSR